MALTVINVCKPTDALYADIFSSVVIYSTSCCFERIVVGDIKLSVARMNRIAQPHFIILQQREDFFVCNGILVADNGKLFSTIHYPRQKFSEL